MRPLVHGSWNNKCSLWLVIVLVFTIVNSIFPPGVGHASEDEMRVALYINQQSLPVYTLSSETGLTVQGESGPFVNVGEANSIRFSLDQFFIIAGESHDVNEMKSLSQKLAQKGISQMIIQQPKQSKTVYRLFAMMGQSTLAEAEKKLQEVKNLGASQAYVAGHFRVQAGSFSTLDEANKRLNQIQTANFNAYLVQVRGNGALHYQVWVGDATSSAGQVQEQEALQKAFPDLSFEPVSGNINEYLIYLNSFLDGTSGQPYYLLSSSKKWTVAPKAVQGKTPLTAVAEKPRRVEGKQNQYRGKMELVPYKQGLALINVLPFEQYIYGVVGSELANGWPIEALKAQAILARNFAYIGKQANKYEIAFMLDSTFDQAYYGFNVEGENIRKAVDATKGEMLTYNGKVFQTYYSSNAGGMSANGTEVWGNAVPTHKVTPSKDTYPAEIAATWYRVQDLSGKFGYVHSQYINKTGTTSPIGFQYGVVNTPSLNYRSGPTTDVSTNIVGSLAEGTRVLIIEEVKQNNAYSWISGPFTGEEIRQAINSTNAHKNTPISQTVTSLKVVERGESGRATKMEANGSVIQVFRDALRSLFKEGGTRSLRSTKFEVEEMGQFTVLSAGGVKAEFPRASTQPVQFQALRAGTASPVEVTRGSDQFMILSKAGRTRIAAKVPMYVFKGYGFGHGLGVSQWGMRALALEGYDYRQILQHYFHSDVKLEKK